MTDGLNIRKISSPIFGASRINATKRENQDSRKRSFQRHLEDEKEDKSDDDSASHTNGLQQEAGSKNGKDGSEGEKIQDPLYKELGKRIDIRV